MATNPYGPYDPYTGEVRQEYIDQTMTMGGLVKEAINPLNYIKWRYQYDPRAWGGGLLKTSGGIWSPFGAKAQKYGFEGLIKNKILADTFKSNISRYGKGPVGIFRSVSKTLEETIGGSTRFGANIIPNARALSKTVEAFRVGVRENMMSAFSKLKPHQAMRIGKIMERKLSDSIIASSGKVGRKAIYQAIKDLSESAFVKDLGLTSREFQKMALSQAGELSKLVSQKGVREAITGVGAAKIKAAGMKLGMIAGKAFAYYGLISTAWDLTKMVAEPIGRYIVENANRVAIAYEQRFAPEMGGKIAMSYMTSGAATERQRAVDAISRSYINGRSALGNEANFFHG